MENLDARGTLADPQPISTGSSGALPVDIDNDGDIDLLTISSDASVGDSLHSFLQISLHENVGGRTFVHRGELAGDIEAHQLWLDAADMDGDGDLDVAVNVYSAHTSENLFWLENTRFGVQHRVRIEGNAIRTTLLDLDGDDDLDVIGEVDDRRITLYENTDGQFTLVPVGQIQDEFVVALDDLDNDGDVDLLTRHAHEGRFISRDISAGDMHLTFQQELVFSGSPQPVDFDRDGRVDLISVEGGQVTLYRNRLPGDSNGDGLFDSSDLISVFEAGGYEDRVPDNSHWEHGDWNGDGEFDTADLVYAFQQSRSAATAGTVHRTTLPETRPAADGTDLELGPLPVSLAFASHRVVEQDLTSGCWQRRDARRGCRRGSRRRYLVIRRYFINVVRKHRRRLRRPIDHCGRISKRCCR